VMMLTTKWRLKILAFFVMPLALRLDLSEMPDAVL